MTENISEYKFDFEREAEALMQSLGRKGKRILFVETEVIPYANGSSPKINFHRVVGNQQLKKKRLATVRKRITSTFNKDAKSSSYHHRTEPFFARSYSYVAFREEERFSETFGNSNKALMRLFILYHETGHALLSPLITNKNSPLEESMADAYAALRLFQRFGEEAKPLLSMISWQRAMNAMVYGAEHLTTTVLDRIIADSATQDFSKLTSDETIKLAKTYAKEWTPTKSMLKEAKSSFVAKGNEVNLDLLASTCLSSPANDFTFYIAAKVFQPYIHLDEVIKDGVPIVLNKRHDYAASIAQHSNMNLYHLFNKTAARPGTEPRLLETLRVSLPPGQTRFVYKP